MCVIIVIILHYIILYTENSGLYILIITGICMCFYCRNKISKITGLEIINSYYFVMQSSIQSICHIDHPMQECNNSKNQ